MRSISPLIVVLPWLVAPSGCAPEEVGGGGTTIGGVANGGATQPTTVQQPTGTSPGTPPAGTTGSEMMGGASTNDTGAGNTGAGNTGAGNTGAVSPGPGPTNVAGEPGPGGGSPAGSATSEANPNGAGLGSPNGGDGSGGDDGVPGPGLPGGGSPSGEGGSGGSNVNPSDGSSGGGTSLGSGGSGGDDALDSAGGSGTNTDPFELDCDAMMPTSGAQQHSGNGTGGEDNLAWEIWSNTGQGELTTYDVPAFSAIWNEAGGYLGRLGYEWGQFGDTPVPYEEHGTITAYFVANKSGSAGGYSYIGMYGWTNDPCVEWYVVEDSYNNLPFNPGGTTDMGDVDIDGGTYIMYTRPTTGTGGSRCSGVNEWIQYYSMRRTPRTCGQISLTEHFDAWKGLGMDMGVLLEAKILVEVGGGTGRVDLPIANVTVTQ